MTTAIPSVKRWFEISLYDEWSFQPSGIARVAQKLFEEAAQDTSLGYIYYHPTQERYLEVVDLTYFVELASGKSKYLLNELPLGAPFDSVLSVSRVLHSVVLTGAGWHYAGFIKEVARLKSFSNLDVACILYDTIAIHSPHFFVNDFAQRVSSCLLSLFEIADQFLCISESTCCDVRALTSSKKLVSKFQLGVDFQSIEASLLVPDRLGLSAYVLCVGTIEVRKNHLLLYYAWRNLVARFGEKCPKLVVVGRAGWLSHDVVELMRRDPLVNDFIEIRNAVEDSELDELYRSCLFTVYPSFYEGYGLPVAESLAYGQVCVSSNASSLSEINPFPELTFNPYDAQTAANVIGDLVQSPEKIRMYRDKVQSTYKRQSWHQSYSDLLGALPVSHDKNLLGLKP